MAQQMSTVAQAAVDKAEKEMPLVTKGTPMLPKPSFFSHVKKDDDRDCEYAGYKWQDELEAKSAQIVFSNGATQTQETVQGKKEEVQFRQALTNSQVKDFEEAVVKELIMHSHPDAVPAARQTWPFR